MNEVLTVAARLECNHRGSRITSDPPPTAARQDVLKVDGDLVLVGKMDGAAVDFCNNPDEASSGLVKCRAVQSTSTAVRSAVITVDGRPALLRIAGPCGETSGRIGLGIPATWSVAESGQSVLRAD